MTKFWLFSKKNDDFYFEAIFKVGNRWQYPLINHFDCELDGFGGLKFLEKTGQCVYSPDVVKGHFMDHCRSKASVYVDPLLIAGKKKDYLLYSTT